jgi:filamentous hemagglutinin family protein
VNPFDRRHKRPAAVAAGSNRVATRLPRKPGRKGVALAVASCFVAGGALANPYGFSIVNGQVFVNYNGNVLNVTNTPGAIIHWQGFSIGVNEITRFIQQSASSTVLNRVVGADPSIILGTLQSNGRVFLINPNGVVFGAGSKVDVSGLVASTLNLTNADFAAGKLRFGDTPGAGNVVNQGSITTPTGGQVYLIAPNVQNHGVISSPQGEVILAAGKSVEIVDSGTPNLRVEITASNNEALNVGKIIANSGKIGIYAGLIRNSGEVRADGVVVGANGEILLKATKNVTLDQGSVVSASGAAGGKIAVQADTGAVTVAGTVAATGAQGAGGTIHISGAQGINVETTARISADGAQGGSVNLVAPGSGITVAAPVSANAATGFAGQIALNAAVITLAGTGAHVSASGGLGGGTIVLNGGNGVTAAQGSFVQAVGATGGTVQVQADQGSIVLQGTIEANGTDGSGGIVTVVAQQDITLDATSRILAAGRAGGEMRIESTNGTVLASGLIDARGHDGRGGKVQLLGPYVGLIRRALVDVSGTRGGGTILVGGDFQGLNPDVRNAWRTYVGADVVLRADGGIDGDGGRVIVWADDITRFYGTVSARGGSQSGNGGFVEISGKHNLDFTGHVDTGAAHGTVGNILFDPDNITIVAGTGTHDAEVSADNIVDFSDGSGTFLIGEDALEALSGTITLRANNQILVSAGLNGGELTLTNPGTNLYLEGGANITINSPIRTSGFMGFYSNSMNINADITSVNDSIYLIPTIGSGTAINLVGTKLGGSLELTPADLNHVHLLNPSAVLQIGDPLSTTGNINVATALTNGAGGATEHFQNLKLQTGSGHSISINAPVTVSNMLHLDAGGNIQQNASGVITANQLLATSSANVLLQSAGNLVGTLAGNATGSFLFKNAQSLTVGSVGGVYGITADGGEGVPALVDIAVVGAGNTLTVNESIRANNNGQNNVFATINLTASNGITIMGDGAEGSMGLYASGGYGSSGVGGSAFITLNGGSGPILVDNYARIEADGGHSFAQGGDANVTLTTTGGITFQNSAYAEASGGNGGSSGSGDGGIGSVLLTSGNAGILLDSAASVRAFGGDGGEGGYSSGGGYAVVHLRTDAGGAAAGNITVRAGSWIQAVGGDGGDDQYMGSSTGEGGSGTVTVASGTGGILIENAFVQARGGDAGDYYESGNGTGGTGTVELLSTGAIAVTGSSALTASGGNGSFWSGEGNGGNATLTLHSGAGGITIDGAEGAANSGNGGEYGGDGGLAKVVLNGGGGAILLDNGANLYVNGSGAGYAESGIGGAAEIQLLNASSITLDHGSYLYAQGGDGYQGGGSATISLNSLGAGGINIDNASYAAAYGGYGSDGGEGSAVGGLASVALTASGSGMILIQNSGAVYAQGGDGAYAGGNATVTLTAGTGGILLNTMGSAAARGGDGGEGGYYGSYSTGHGGNANTVFSTSGGIHVLGGGGVYAYGGDGQGYDYANGGNASISLTSGANGITLNAGEVRAEGGYGPGSYIGNGGDATIELSGGYALIENASQIKAMSGSADYGSAGEALVEIIGSASVTVDSGSSIEAYGGSSSYSGYGFAEARLASGVDVLLKGGTISVDGAEGSSIHIEAVGGKIIGNGAVGTLLSAPSGPIELGALKGVGTVGNAVRITDTGQDINVCNGGDFSAFCTNVQAGASGDIVLAQTTGLIMIDSMVDVINLAPNGGFDVTAETGGILVTNNVAMTANGNGIIGLHALGGSIQVDNGSTLNTAHGTITLQSDQLDLFGSVGSINAGSSGTVVLRPAAPTTSINLGGLGSAGILGIDNATLSGISAGVLRIGDITDTAGIAVSGIDLTGIANTLSLTTGGDITQTGALTATNLAIKSKGNVTLNDVSNSVLNVAADLTGGVGSLGFTATGYNVAGTAIDGVSGVRTNGGNITLASPNPGEGIFVVPSGGGYTIDTGASGGVLTISTGDWLVVNDFADMRAGQIALSSGNSLGIAVGQINLVATGVGATAVNLSAPSGPITSSADITSAGGVRMNSAGDIRLDYGHFGSTIVAAGAVDIQSVSGSIYAGVADTEYVNITGGSVMLNASGRIDLGRGVAGSNGNVHATAGNIDITSTSPTDGFGGCAFVGHCYWGNINADAGNITINTNGFTSVRGNISASGSVFIKDTGVGDPSSNMLRVKNVTAGTTITLESASVIWHDPALGGLLSAPGISLKAATGIGAAGNFLKVSASGNLAGQITGTGNMYLDFGAGPANIGTVGSLNGLNAGAGNVTLTTTGTVAQSQTITAAGLELLGAGGVYNLNTQNNAITTLAGSTGTVKFRDNSGFDIGTVNTIGLTIAGNATLDTTGTVTQSQAIAAAGLELLGAGGTYQLNTQNNAISTLAGNTGTVKFRDNSGFDIGTVNTIGLTTGGNATLDTTGNVTQSQAVTAAGLELLGTGGTYNLASVNNAITTLAVNSGTVKIKDNTGFSIGTVNSTVGATASGYIALNSTGTVTQSQKIMAAGLELLGAGGTFTLTDGANDVTTLAANTASVTYTDATALLSGTVGGTTGITGTALVELTANSLTGTGVISAPTVNLATANGMSVRVAGTGAGLNAANSTSGDIVVTGTGASFTVGSGGAIFTNAAVGGGYYISAVNDLQLNAGTAHDRYARFAAGGTLTTDGYTNASGFGSLFLGNNVVFSGAGTAISGALGVIGGTVDVYTTVTGNTVNVTATTLNVAGGDFQSTSGNFTGYIAGTVNVSLGGRIFGNPDVDLTVGTGINIMDPGSKIEAASASTVRATFPTLAPGGAAGYSVNGNPGVVWDAGTGTGFFAGGAPAELGSGFIAIYGATGGVSPSVVTAINNVVDATNKSAPSTQKDKDKDKEKDKGTNSDGTTTSTNGVAMQCGG